MEVGMEDILRICKEKRASISKDSHISAPFSVGTGTNINGKITIKGLEQCSIGNYCAIGFDVKINTTDHLTTRANLQVALQNRLNFNPVTKENGQVIIGHNVWVGDCAILLPGVKIGDGAVVGAGAIVTKNIPPFAVVAGSPG